MELAAELGVQVVVEVHLRCGDGCSTEEGEQCGGCAPATEDGGAEKHARKHRRVRCLRSAVGDLFRRVRKRAGSAHPSPRSAKTGSNFTARRMAAALPAKGTKVALSARQVKSTGSMRVCES